MTYALLWAGALVAWLSLPRFTEARPEDQADKDAAEPRRHGGMFLPAAHGGVAGITKNGGWWE